MQTDDFDAWEYKFSENAQPSEKLEVNLNSRPMNDSETVSQFDSAVDIIVPFYGQYEHVTRLVESIFQFTRSNYYRLFVVDDASPNGSFIENLANNSRGAIRALRCKERKGFAGALKVGFNRGSSPYICAVNSDCVIEDINWLRAMGEALRDMKEQNVRMISPKTNNPVGGHEFQKGKDKLFRGPNEIIPDGEHLSMYCFMCHRDLFSHCGGFLKEYPYGYYEDEEFAHRMKRHGFKQGVAGKSWIYHKGECTVKSTMKKSPKIRKIMEEENRDRCVADIKSL